MSTMQLPAHGDSHTQEHGHPPVRTYVMIGIVLAILTAIEVALYYVEVGMGGAAKPIIVPSLLALAFAKFVLVVGWFMHLRFDHRFLTYTFVFGLLVATSILIALLAIHAQYPLPPQVPSGGAGH